MATPFYVGNIVCPCNMAWGSNFLPPPRCYIHNPLLPGESYPAFTTTMFGSTTTPLVVDHAPPPPDYVPGGGA